MDSEIKNLIEKNLALTEENNKLLRKMQRRARWGTITHIIYWIIILGITFGSYYYIQPYLNQALSAYSSLQKNVNGLNNGINNLNSSNPFQGLLNGIKK